VAHPAVDIEAARESAAGELHVEEQESNIDFRHDARKISFSGAFPSPLVRASGDYRLHGRGSLRVRDQAEKALSGLSRFSPGIRALYESLKDYAEKAIRRSVAQGEGLDEEVSDK